MPNIFVIIGSGYRYGFNGHEKDDEVKGAGNQLGFGDYGYDSRLGRRWNIDPKNKQTPYESPYSISGNSPLLMVDQDGLKKTVYLKVIAKDGKVTVFEIVNHKYVAVKSKPTMLLGIINTHDYTQIEYDVVQHITLDLSGKEPKRIIGDPIYKERSLIQQIGNMLSNTFIDDEQISDQKSGIAWTSMNGKGQETRRAEEFSMNDIDALLDVVTGLGTFANAGSGGLKIPKSINDKIPELQIFMDLTDRTMEVASKEISVASKVDESLDKRKTYNPDADTIKRKEISGRDTLRPDDIR